MLSKVGKLLNTELMSSLLHPFYSKIYFDCCLGSNKCLRIPDTLSIQISNKIFSAMHAGIK